MGCKKSFSTSMYFRQPHRTKYQALAMTKLICIASSIFLLRSHPVRKHLFAALLQQNVRHPTASTTVPSCPANALLASSPQRAPVPSPQAAPSPPTRIGVFACSGIAHDLRSPHINHQIAFYQQERVPQRHIQRRDNVAGILGCRKKWAACWN